MSRLRIWQRGCGEQRPPDRIVAAHLAGAQEPVSILQPVENALLAGDEVSEEDELRLAGIDEPSAVKQPVARDRPAALPAARVDAPRQRKVAASRQVEQTKIRAVRAEDELVDGPVGVDPPV